VDFEPAKRRWTIAKQDRRAAIVRSPLPPLTSIGFPRGERKIEKIGRFALNKRNREFESTPLHHSVRLPVMAERAGGGYTPAGEPMA
jgi:hypothetical protein